MSRGGRSISEIPGTIRGCACSPTVRGSICPPKSRGKQYGRVDHYPSVPLGTAKESSSLFQRAAGGSAAARRHPSTTITMSEKTDTSAHVPNVDPVTFTATEVQHAPEQGPALQPERASPYAKAVSSVERRPLGYVAGNAREDLSFDSTTRRLLRRGGAPVGMQIHTPMLRELNESLRDPRARPHDHAAPRACAPLRGTSLGIASKVIVDHPVGPGATAMV